MSRRTLAAFVLLFLAVLGLWAYFPALVKVMVPGTEAAKVEWEARGVFGDSFGVLNSLFSALAFCGIVVTLYMQNAQMRFLRQQEKDGERIQRLQSSLMAVTAALNYYNSEADRLQSMMHQVMQNENDNSAAMRAIWTHSFMNITNRRTQLIAELENLLKANGGLSDAEDVSASQAVA